MRKLILIPIIISQINGSSFIDDFSENARIREYENISKKITEIKININKENYLNYVNKLNIKTTFPKILINEQNILNKEFSLNKETFNYKFYINKITYKLPEKERLELIKLLTEESAEYLIVKDLYVERLKEECSILKIKKERSKKINKEEKAKYNEGKPSTWTYKEDRILKELEKEKCIDDTLTVNQKYKLLNKIEKKAFKYLLLRKLYLTKDDTLEIIKDKIKYYKSKEYQDLYKIKKDYTIKGILFKEKEKEKEKKVKVKKISKEKMLSKNIDNAFKSAEDKINKMKIGKDRNFVAEDLEENKINRYKSKYRDRRIKKDNYKEFYEE